MTKERKNRAHILSQIARHSYFFYTGSKIAKDASGGWQKKFLADNEEEKWWTFADDKAV